MDWRTISDDQQLAMDLAEQHAQEAHDVVGVIDLLLGLHEEAAVRGDATDGGLMVAGERHRQQRRLPTRCPGAHHHGQQVEARLV